MAEYPFKTNSNFLEGVRKEVMSFARNYCKVWATEEDCEDLTQQAMMTMLENVHSGRLTELTCRLSTYVNGILKKLANKQYEKRQQAAFMTSKQDEDEDEDESIESIDIAIAREAVMRWADEESKKEHERAEEEMRKLVQNMPEPCKTILWSFYWEGKSMSDIAAQMGYANARVAKSKKSQCMSKVRAAKDEILRRIRL